MKIIAFSNTVNQIKLATPQILTVNGVNTIKTHGNESDAEGKLVYTDNLRITFTASEASQLPSSLKADYISKMAKLRAKSDSKPIQFKAKTDYNLNPDSVRIVTLDDGNKVVKAVYRPLRDRKPAFTCSLEL